MPSKLRASSPATTKAPHEPLAAPWWHPLWVQRLQPGPGSCLGTLSSLTEVAKHSSEQPQPCSRLPARGLPGVRNARDVPGVGDEEQTSEESSAGSQPGAASCQAPRAAVSASIAAASQW